MRQRLAFTKVFKFKRIKQYKYGYMYHGYSYKEFSYLSSYSSFYNGYPVGIKIYEDEDFSFFTKNEYEGLQYHEKNIKFIL